MAHAKPRSPATTNRRVGAAFVLVVGALGAVIFVLITVTSRPPDAAYYQQGTLQQQMQRCEASVNLLNLGDTPACLHIKNAAERERAISEGLSR